MTTSALRAPTPALRAPTRETWRRRDVFFGGAFAAGFALVPPAVAGTLDPAVQLVDELNGLRANVREGKANGNRVKQVVERTISPLRNAMTKNPINEKTEYGDLIAQKMNADAEKLNDALNAKDGFEPIRGSTGDISFPGGRVEKLITSMTESTICWATSCGGFGGPASSRK